METRPVVVFLMLAGVLACAYMLMSHEPPERSRIRGTPEGKSGDEALKEAYARAIKDAETAEEGEICRNLTAIVESNTNLVWSGEPGNSRVLVVTWTSWDGYVNKTTMNATREIWVTTAPQLKGFIAGNEITGDACVLRLEQLLGLPPHNGKKWFVEIWASPKDLFRPSPDPGINDTEAQLDFSKDASPEYREFFNQLKNASYGPGGYPWTRLGYTYDWGGADDEIGLSEFVVVKGADIMVNRAYSTDEFCRQ